MDKASRERFGECRKALRSLETLEERILRRRSRLERMSTTLTDMPGGPRETDPIGKGVAELDELCRQWNAQATEYRELAGEAEDAIDALPENERMIMRLRYVDGMPWKEVAAAAGYTESRCYQLHSSAFEKVYSQL